MIRSGSSSINTLDQLVEADPDLPIVVIGNEEEGQEAVSDYLRHGAATYLPFENAERDLEDALVEALTTSRQRATEQTLRRAIERPYSFENFLGESPPMKAVYNLIERVATSSVDILITGETGTGKELVAQAVHQRSRRKEAPFVPIDCGAIPETLLESELFGHERGAFTGADARRIGLIEVADGGTLFLDEVAELPPSLQAKLLRVLQERRLRRVGARQETPVDVRIVAATSRNIDVMVENGTFRRDLFYRINVVRISLPPLRQRGDDIGLLAEFFASRAGREMGRDDEDGRKRQNAVFRRRETRHLGRGAEEKRKVIEHSVRRFFDGRERLRVELMMLRIYICNYIALFIRTPTRIYLNNNNFSSDNNLTTMII